MAKTGLKGFREFDQIPLVIILQLGAEGVTDVASSRHTGFILEAPTLRIRAGSNYATFLGS